MVFGYVKNDINDFGPHGRVAPGTARNSSANSLGIPRVMMFPGPMSRNCLAYHAVWRDDEITQDCCVCLMIQLMLVRVLHQNVSS